MAAENAQPTSTAAPAEQQPVATPVATPAPAASAPPAQAKPAPPVVPAPPAQPAAVAPEADPELSKLTRAAFNARIASAEQAAQRRVYESLGKGEEEIKALLAAEAERAEAQKSLEQRIAEREAQLAAEKAKRGALEKTVAQRAALEMTQLSESQRQAVFAVIERLGADPKDGAAQLGALDALRPTWSAAADAQAAQTAAAVQQPTAPPPVSPVDTATAPDPNAPGDGSPTSPPDHKSIYRDLKSRNPFEAAEYARLHPDVWDGMVR